MSRTLFMFMSMMKFWKNISNFPIIVRIIFWKIIQFFFQNQFFSVTSGAPSIRCATSKFEIFWIFFLLDLKSLVTFFLFGFWGFWKCLTGFPRLNLDVTFRVDDFSYKIFSSEFVCKSYAHFTNSREILQIKSKIIL